MNTTSHLTPLDVAIAAYLAHYRTLGRGYGQEEWVLGLLRTSLAERGATDLDQERFDQWRGTFVHLHLNSRHTYERIVEYQVRLQGKGNKVRLCPIWPATAKVVRDYIEQQRLADADLAEVQRSSSCENS
jgi:hypothetical protein